MKVTLTSFKAVDVDQKGVPLVDKNGKHYWKGFIKTREHGDRYVSNNYMREDEAQTMRGWAEGMELELDIEEEEWQGKKYMKFRFPRKTVSRKEFDSLMGRVTSLEATIKFLNVPNPGQIIYDEPPF